MENNMSMVKVFENEQFGAVRTIEDGDKVLFSATDVARALGYSNPHDAIKRHCKGVVKHEGVSITKNQHGTKTEQRNEMSFIPEGDVYRLIARSKLPEAEKFEKWVFDEVLPTIRKTGGYINSSQQLVETYFPTVDPDQKVAIGLLFENIRVQQEQLRIAKPKADYFDKLVDAGANLGIRQFAKELKVSERKLVKFMLDNKYLYRDKKGKLLPYAEYTGKLFEVKEFVAENGYTNVKTLFTPAGRDYFLKLGIVDKLKEAC